MSKFLELSFVNHTRNNDEIADKFFATLEPVLNEMRKYLSKEIADDIEDLFSEVATDALYYAGVVGMELAIGVINGTIQQRIE